MWSVKCTWLTYRDISTQNPIGGRSRRGTWLIHTCAMTQTCAHVWHDSYDAITLCDISTWSSIGGRSQHMTHLYTWHDLYSCTFFLFYVADTQLNHCTTWMVRIQLIVHTSDITHRHDSYDATMHSSDITHRHDTHRHESCTRLRHVPRSPANWANLFKVHSCVTHRHDTHRLESCTRLTSLIRRNYNCTHTHTHVWHHSYDATMHFE